jgi:hypothetical protein
VTGRGLLACASLAAMAACSVPAADGTYVPGALPDRASFPPVAQLLDVRCGSLNCHGTTARNLRLYGSAADPDQLTMVRKARGIESHKGGQIWSQGDDSDSCLTSWLAGAANATACARGMASVLPNGSSNPLMECLGAP